MGASLVAPLSRLQIQGGEEPAQTGLVPRLPDRSLSPATTPPPEYLPSAPRSLRDGRERRKTKTEVSPLGQHQKARQLGGVPIKGRSGAWETSRPQRSVFKDRVEGKALSSECQGRG